MTYDLLGLPVQLKTIKVEGQRSSSYAKVHDYRIKSSFFGCGCALHRGVL